MMFYDKRIEILGTSEGYTDDWGIYHPGQEIPIKTIDCDVQPYSAELLYRDYGYNEQVTKRAFCDIDPLLKTGGYVRYNNQKYIIKKIIEWDDYVELMLYEQ
mgnify:FL=1